MLEQLNIRNLATVAELTISFSDGLNVLTGETGAGKSVILGAMQTLLGERADKTMIRHGADRCEITASLIITDRYCELRKIIDTALDQAGVTPCEDNQLLLRRVITASNSRAFVNATPVTLQVMRDLGQLLVDIHGPNDHQSLLNTGCQLSLLDSFGNHDQLLQQCRHKWSALRNLGHRLEELQQEHLNPEERELLRHQLREIDDAELAPGEQETLIERHQLASHAQRLVEITSHCQQGLVEADSSICDQFSHFVRLGQELAGLAPESGQELLTRLEQIVEDIQEVSNDLANFGESLDLNSQELAAMEERLNLIMRLQRKYGGNLEAVLATAQRLRERLDNIDNHDSVLAALQNDYRQAAECHAETCRALSEQRHQAAKRLAAAITDKLGRLGFAQSQFGIDIETVKPAASGSDRVEFCFAPNPGESLLPLRKIASSGEIARVMLAVKTVLSAADQVPLLIFDEVDANIGGRVATQVATELQLVADRHQVLCITHLPQIAAAANIHFLVSKKIEDGRTMTEVDQLDKNTRIAEIARMMGAEDLLVAHEHARQMLGE